MYMALLFEPAALLIGYLCKHITLRLVGEMLLIVNASHWTEIGVEMHAVLQKYFDIYEQCGACYEIMVYQFIALAQ
jgi:hypothetical protein